MKVLWFSITPAGYGRQAGNGGGWIESLQRVVKKIEALELGIVFMTPVNSEEKKVQRDGVIYYPLYIHRNWCQQWYDKYTYKRIDALILERCKEVVDDFQPDIIHVFGSEWCFGLLYKYTKVPIVIHMQGCWSPYRNAEMPPGFHIWKPIPLMWYKPRRILNYFLVNYISRERAIREQEILSNTRYFMGRTCWDKALTELYSPQSKYFYCSEALRFSFVNSKEKWLYQDKKKRLFITTGLCTNLKGYDVVLKTAKLLREYAKFDFVWELIGPTAAQMKIYEVHTGIKCGEVGIVPMGNQNADVIQKKLLTCDTYIHLAYIDNSPNSICEAQYLGVPVVATYVGGVPSLFAEDYDNRLLVPTNDPYYTASTIISLMQNMERMKMASESNFKIAHERHDDERIGMDLMRCYRAIVGE